MKSTAPFAAVLALALAVVPHAHAGLGGKAARELAEYVTKKFGREAAEEGAEKLAGRIARAATRHGDDMVSAVRKVGPKAIRLADDAGEQAPRVLRFLNRYGDDAARALSKPRGLALLGRFGDDAAEVLVKHQGVAEPLLETMGAPAARALKSLGPQGGRRLAMMAGDDLAAIGRTPELLDVVARFGDPAMDFIWRHKAALAGGAALAAFLRDPEPFLNGTAELTRAVSQEVVQPAASAAARAFEPVAREAGRAMQPAVGRATEAAGTALLYVGVGVLLVMLSLTLIARAISKSGLLGKLVVRTGLRVAGAGIKGAVKRR